MNGKYYVFKCGDDVPSWMIAADFTSMDRRSLAHNMHHGKIEFRRSCVVIRGDENNNSIVMPMFNSYGNDCVIKISGFNNANIGRVRGASGVNIKTEQTPASVGAK